MTISVFLFPRSDMVSDFVKQLSRFHPFIPDLQVIEPACPRNQALFLQPSHDDTWSYPKPERELGYLNRIISQGFQVLRFIRRYQDIGGPSVRLGLLFHLQAVLPALKEEQFFAVKQQMGELMKQGEPEVVVAFISETQHHQGSSRSKPLGYPRNRTAHALREAGLGPAALFQNIQNGVPGRGIGSSVGTNSNRSLPARSRENRF